MGEDFASNPRVSATNDYLLPKTYSETAWIAASFFICAGFEANDLKS
jgi:hypothetical protein